MAKIDWKIYSLSYGDFITDKVLSFNFSFGREKYLDTYSGNLLNVTINNAGDFASTIPYGSAIYVESYNGGSREYWQIFWVQEINYNDHPGDTGLSTATIVCADWLSRAGRVQANELAIPQNTISGQYSEFNSINSGPLPSDMTITELPESNSIGSAITYTGTVTNYVNLGVTTERGYLVVFQDFIRLINRDRVGTYTPVTIQLGRTATSTQIGYQSFDRIQNGLQFINNSTITSTGVADQNALNATSVSTYGNAFYSSQTVDYNATQANGNANWIVNVFDDPAALRFSCSFTDTAQDSTAMISLIHQMFWNQGTNRILTLNYQVPGGSPTSTTVVLEGYSFSVTPQQTMVTFEMSPLLYYQFFTLDSTTLGILSGEAFTYDRAGIMYNQSATTYDDTYFLQGSRLGW